MLLKDIAYGQSLSRCRRPASSPPCTAVSSCPQDILSHGLDLDAAVAAGATRALEPWCEVPYCFETASEELLARWEDPAPSPLLELPPRNEFIPRDFTLRGEAAAAAVSASAASEEEAEGEGEEAGAGTGTGAEVIAPPTLLTATDRRAALRHICVVQLPKSSLLDLRHCDRFRVLPC